MIETKPIDQLRTYNDKIVIAGPCSVESEEQILHTAQQLKKIGIKIFRAGIWKPRTRPNTFEGVGTEGLEWIKRVKDETYIETWEISTQSITDPVQAGQLYNDKDESITSSAIFESDGM
mgnify:CR=1 FL=1